MTKPKPKVLPENPSEAKKPIGRPPVKKMRVGVPGFRFQVELSTGAMYVDPSTLETLRKVNLYD